MKNMKKKKINKKEECLHLPNPHSISQFQFQFQSFTPKLNIIFIYKSFELLFLEFLYLIVQLIYI
jgi:hypothetical protein